MRFGIFYEHQLPKPWNDGDEARLFHQALEQVVLADRLGYDYAWEVEHHFLEEYSHSSAPEVFLAACAALTKTIRVGHGIRQVIPNYNHPCSNRRGSGDAGHRLQWTSRLRHRRRRNKTGARRFRDSGQGKAGHGARGG